MGNNNYFRGGRTYEAALLYQLYGQFYAVQSQYTNAIPWFEKALATDKMPRIGAQEVRFQLAQTYFMVGKYENVIPLLEDFINIAKELELDYLIEVHDEAELKRIAHHEGALIGINNRDLKTFEVDLDNSVRLRKLFKEENIFIA